MFEIKIRTNDSSISPVDFMMNKLLWARQCARLVARSLSTPAPGSRAAMNPKYRPSEFQKLILVWTKKFKSKAEIPSHVSLDLIERSRSEARIKIANVMMLLTALASLGAVMSGKAAAKRGESVQQMNLDWHQQYRDEQDRKEQAAKK